MSARVRTGPVRAGVLLALALAAGCKSLPFPDPKLEGPYGAMLERHVRSATVYEGLEARAFVRVVWVSPALAEQQARELSARRNETPAEAAARLEAARQGRGRPTFFAIVHTSDFTWNDWHKPDSAWRLALAARPELRPERVVRFAKPFHAEQVALYPFLDDQQVGYQIEFPPSDLPGPPTLELSSVLGRASFDFSK